MAFQTLAQRNHDGQAVQVNHSNKTVTVFGAYGHTGQFVVTELRNRGYVPVLSGRNSEKLHKLAASHPDLDTRPSRVDDPAALDQALAGAAAVINCAGPFATTAAPVIEAALRAGIPYVDVAAEIEANLDTFTNFTTRAQEAQIVVLPAMAFYGGLGDLLTTTAMADWPTADEAHIAYGLSSWHPTAGTLAAGKISRDRRNGRHVRYTNGQLEYHDNELSVLDWPFPTGPRPVIADFTMADVVTIPSHLPIPEVRTYMTTNAVKDLSTPAAAPSGAAQTFVVDVRVRSNGKERRAVASGQDIYAVTAPLAVEAVHRILTNQTTTTGVASAGKLFNAPDFLNALSSHISLTQNTAECARRHADHIAENTREVGLVGETERHSGVSISVEVLAAIEGHAGGYRAGR